MSKTRQGSTKKVNSSHDQSKACIRGHGQNNLSQEQQFQIVKGGQSCGCRRGKNEPLTKKKSHPLNEILEDSDYDKDPTESSLS
jgi:hypothetical protein